MRLFVPLLLALVVLAPALALAQPTRQIDIVVTLAPGKAPTVTPETGILTFVNETPGERVQFRLTSPRDQVSIEVRVEGGFQVERPQQLVPHLVLDAGEATCIDVRAKGACDDTLFVPFPDERIWEYDSPARVYSLNGTSDGWVLRLGVPGPANATLALVRDITPPKLTVAAPTNLTHLSFFAESLTDELAIVDLQVRKVGATEWVLNPTPDPNVRQRFPIQGLSPATTYEYRYVATDWAGNEATSPTYTITTLAQPVVERPTVSPLAPLPNATLSPGDAVVVRARVEGVSPVHASGLRFFYDKQAITEGLVFEGRDFSWSPPKAPAAGHHSIALEATNEAGGTGSARWTFDVGGNATPALAPGIVVVLALALALAMARRT